MLVSDIESTPNMNSFLLRLDTPLADVAGVSFALRCTALAALCSLLSCSIAAILCITILAAVVAAALATFFAVLALFRPVVCIQRHGSDDVSPGCPLFIGQRLSKLSNAAHGSMDAETLVLRAICTSTTVHVYETRPLTVKQCTSRAGLESG